MIERLMWFCTVTILLQASLVAAKPVPTDAQILHAGCYIDVPTTPPSTWTLLPTKLGSCVKDGPAESNWFIYRKGKTLIRCQAGEPSCPTALPAGVDTALRIEEVYGCNGGRMTGPYKATIMPVSRTKRDDLKKYQVTVETEFSSTLRRMSHFVRTTDSQNKICRQMYFDDNGRPTLIHLYSYYGYGVHKVDEYNGAKHLAQHSYKHGKLVSSDYLGNPPPSDRIPTAVYSGPPYRFYLVGTLKGGVTNSSGDERGADGTRGLQLNAGYLPCQDGTCYGGILTLGIDQPANPERTVKYAEIGGLIYSWYIILYAGGGPRWQTVDDQVVRGYQVTAAFGLLFSSLYFRVFNAQDALASGYEFGLQLHAPIIF